MYFLLIIVCASERLSVCSGVSVGPSAVRGEVVGANSLSHWCCLIFELWLQAGIGLISFVITVSRRSQ